MADTKTLDIKSYGQAAKAISVLTTPAIIGSLLLFYILYSYSSSVEIFFKSFIIVFTFSIAFPVLFTFLLLKKEKISNFHLKERKERTRPFAFALISSAGSLLAIKYFGGSPELARMVLILYLMALGYVTITLLKFKISGHIFIFSAAVLALTFNLNLQFIYLFPLVAIIGWSRVYLKEHTSAEIAGAIIYATVSFLVFSLLINN